MYQTFLKWFLIYGYSNYCLSNHVVWRRGPLYADTWINLLACLHVRITLALGLQVSRSCNAECHDSLNRACMNKKVLRYDPVNHDICRTRLKRRCTSLTWREASYWRLRPHSMSGKLGSMRVRRYFPPIPSYSSSMPPPCWFHIDCDLALRA